MQGVLNPAEEQLLRISGVGRGRVLLKEVRKELIETSRPILDALVKQATGHEVMSLHHDISTVTGEEIVLFTLVKASSPQRSRK